MHVVRDALEKDLPRCPSARSFIRADLAADVTHRVVRDLRDLAADWLHAGATLSRGAQQPVEVTAPALATQDHAEEFVERVLSLRRRFPLRGPFPDPCSSGRVPTWPFASTLGAILKRHGLVNVRRMRDRVPPRTRPFLAVATPAGCATRSRSRTRPRYPLACVAMHEPTIENVRRVFIALFRRYSLPQARSPSRVAAGRCCDPIARGIDCQVGPTAYA